jgi:hypothetical protein
MFKKYIILIFVNLIFTNILFPQIKGDITGRVTDNFSKQPIQDVIVRIIELDLKTGTDEDGFFRFSGIEPGMYKLEFSSLGYVPVLKSDIIVRTGSPVNVLAELEIVQTEEIIVQSERFIKPVDLSTSYKNLTNEEIRRSPGGFEDIGRVVQTLPGVSFINDGRNDLIVRGGAPAENLFVVDNAFVPNINHFGSQGATGGPTSIIDLNFINEINFITGGFSARYGDKLSSVLEIKLREGNRNKFSGNINLSATGFGAILEGPIGSKKRGSWLFSARRSYLDFVFNAVGFGFIPEYTSLQFKGVYEISNNNIFTVNFIGNNDKVRFNNDTEENRQNNEDILSNNQWGYVNSYELRSVFSSKSYFLFTLSRNYTNYEYSGRDAEFVETFKNLSEEGETHLKTEFFWLPEKTTQISAGIGGVLINFTNEIMSAEDTLFFGDPERIIIPAVNINSDNNTYKLFSYVQLSQRLFEKFKLNLGLRYDYFDFIEEKNYLSPRVSLSYSLFDNFNINASYGIFYQSPSYIWLISNQQNTQLTDIRADHYIAGIEYIPVSDLRASVEVYYKDYSNYPASTLRPYFILANNGAEYQKPENFGLEPLLSQGVGYTRGIEFFFQKYLTNDFYGNLNLSLFEAKYTSLDGIERSGDYNNRFLFIASGGYMLGKGWEISSKFRWFGGRPYTPINPVTGIQNVEEYNSARYPDYYSLDLRVDKRWNFKKWSLITYIDIQNITGRKNITGYKWNEYENVVEANESIGVFPTIGINATF